MRLRRLAIRAPGAALLALLCAAAFAAEYDEGEMAAKEAAREACEREAQGNVQRRLDCIKRMYRERKRAGAVRGTEAYCLAHYHPLDTEALADTYRELRAGMEASRYEVTEGLGEHGELTHARYSVEVRCVAKELDRRGAWPVKRRQGG